MLHFFVLTVATFILTCFSNFPNEPVAQVGYIESKLPFLKSEGNYKDPPLKRLLFLATELYSTNKIFFEQFPYLKDTFRTKPLMPVDVQKGYTSSCPVLTSAKNLNNLLKNAELIRESARCYFNQMRDFLLKNRSYFPPHLMKSYILPNKMLEFDERKNPVFALISNKELLNQLTLMRNLFALAVAWQSYRKDSVLDLQGALIKDIKRLVEENRQERKIDWSQETQRLLKLSFYDCFSMFIKELDVLKNSIIFVLESMKSDIKYVRYLPNMVDFKYRQELNKINFKNVISVDKLIVMKRDLKVLCSFVSARSLFAFFEERHIAFNTTCIPYATTEWIIKDYIEAIQTMLPTIKRDLYEPILKILKVRFPEKLYALKNVDNSNNENLVNSCEQLIKVWVHNVDCEVQKIKDLYFYTDKMLFKTPIPKWPNKLFQNLDDLIQTIDQCKVQIRQKWLLPGVKKLNNTSWASEIGFDSESFNVEVDNKDLLHKSVELIPIHRKYRTRKSYEDIATWADKFEEQDKNKKEVLDKITDVTKLEETSNFITTKNLDNGFDTNVIQTNSQLSLASKDSKNGSKKTSLPLFVFKSWPMIALYVIIVIGVIAMIIIILIKKQKSNIQKITNEVATNEMSLSDKTACSA